MKYLLLISFIFATTFFANAQLFVAKKSTVNFFSATPIENIQAECKDAKVLINVKTNEIAFLISNTSFQFENKLMQEHFNEKYIESEKYPMSTFKGRINEQIDLTQNGAYNVTVTGKLNIHGVEQDRTITGIITVKDGSIHVSSDFIVKVADHKIEIPKLVVKKVAEEIAVKVEVDLVSKK